MVSYGFLRFPYGFPKGFLRFSYGFSKGFLWFPIGFPNNQVKRDPKLCKEIPGFHGSAFHGRRIYLRIHAWFWP